MIDNITIPRATVQQALEALEELDGLDTETECVTIDVGDAITSLRTALEQQQAEPVAAVDEVIHAAWSAGYVEGEKAVLEQQAEPVHGDIRALKYRIHELEGEVMGYKRMLDVAEAASQRKPLTDAEIDQLLPEIVSGGSFTVITYGRAVARAIEAAHCIQEPKP